MTFEIRDEIYLRIEAERLEQEREGFTAETYKQELIAIGATVQMLLTELSRQVAT